MGRNTYRLCVFETPAQLASEVNELLSKGWDLYGFPFVDANGNGDDTVQQSVFCQAMLLDESRHAEMTTQVVEAAVPRPVVPRPAARKPIAARKLVAPRPPKVRPPRPRIAVTFRNVAGFLAVLMGSYFAIEALIFRSGVYARILEPESSSGDFERTVYGEIHRAPSGKKEVMIIGSSRLAEDFAARIANEIKPDNGYWFVNGCILHGGVRDWYYFIREIDPKRNRYRAIMVPLEDYDDPDVYTDVPDRVVDLRLTVSRLRLTDILPFTSSFRTWPGRFEVFRGSLLKGVVYQRDFQEFAEDPMGRITKAELFRGHAADWFYAYGGISHALTGLSVDWSQRRVTSLPADNQGGEWAEYYRKNLIDDTPQNGIMRTDQVRWVGELVDLYRGSQTKIIVYQVPRGPAMPPYPRAHLAWTTVDDLKKRPWVTIVDRHKFESLEEPEFFGDLLHLNSDGRAVFTPMLVAVAKEVLR